VAWVCKWPDYKARFQALVEELGGVVYKHTYECGTASSSGPGSCPESFKEPIRALIECGTPG
jgi:hypothetical protein